MNTKSIWKTIKIVSTALTLMNIALLVLLVCGLLFHKTISRTPIFEDNIILVGPVLSFLAFLATICSQHFRYKRTFIVFNFVMLISYSWLFWAWIKAFATAMEGTSPG